MDSNRIIQRYQKLKSRRDGYWMEVWREARKYCYPTYSDYLSEGGVRGSELFDDTAIEARKRLAAGMQSWMFPIAQRWFEFRAGDKRFEQDGEVSMFFAESSQKCMEAMGNSTWTGVLTQALNNLACGIDAIIFTEDGGAHSSLVFHSWPAETVVYAENSRREVDTLFRECKMSARQIRQEFPEANLPQKIAEAAADMTRQDEEFTILHAIYPRETRDREMADNKNFAFADVYIDMQSKQVIDEGGFEEQPFAVLRFDLSDNESCGRGPGIDKLPSIKMLQRMRQVYIQNSEFIADPSWLIPDGSLVDGKFNKNPGAVNVYRPGASDSKPVPVYAGGDIRTLSTDIEAERNGVKLGFFWDIFDPLGDLKQITATEAEIRNEGKLIPFAPIAGNLHTALKPLIHRVFSILMRRGELPEVPQSLLEYPEYRVEFVSKIALSLRKLESLGYLQTEASLVNLAAIKPDVMDNFDLDGIARDIALVNGMSPKRIVSERDRDAVRQARAEQQQAQQQAELLAQGASLAPGLGKAPEPGSPMRMMMDGQGV